MRYLSPRGRAFGNKAVILSERRYIAVIPEELAAIRARQSELSVIFARLSAAVYPFVC